MFVKKLSNVLLCLLLVGLCACEKVDSETTTTTQKETTTTTEQKTEYPTVNTTVKIETNPDDPYSFVVADVVDGGIKWPMEEFDWRDDYAFYDIVGSGTQALLLGIKNSNGEVQEIYTIKDGIMERKLSTSGDPDRLLRIYKNGTIWANQLNGTGAKGYYRLGEDGQLKLIMGLGVYAKGGGYRVDPTGTERDFFFEFIPAGTEIPLNPDEYNSFGKELLGDREPAEFDWKPLAEYGQ